MPDNVDRERQLREDVAWELPEFVRACDADNDVVVMQQGAFAALLEPNEIVLLGKAVKYASNSGQPRCPDFPTPSIDTLNPQHYHPLLLLLLPCRRTRR